MKKSNIFLSIFLLIFFSLFSCSSKGQRSNIVLIEPGDTENDIIRKAANVVPLEGQVNWQELELTAFVHFTVNTFTDREWGDGTEEPAIFNPTEFDAEQWVKVCKEAGMKLMIVTAKHHDGFCLWPSKYTEHSVKNSQWRDGKGDVIREVSDACRKYGLKFGVYLSPWDRHEQSYGDSPRYNEHFRNQLRELLTDYGDVAVTVNAFSRVPITFILWRGDEEFLPEGNIIFDSTISDYLSTEDINMLCETMAWRLVRLLTAGGDNHSRS